ncbi:hypothetical protein DFH28DRAFT_884986 [Melampsora americana]|nr:hypothetical protein DFH28DRAFT_884986 [Melampsora americana]
MKHFVRHSQSAKHLQAVDLFDAHVAAQNAILPGLNAGHPSSPVPVDPTEPVLDLDNHDGPEYTLERPPSPLSHLHALQIADVTEENVLDDSDLEVDIHKIAEAIWAMEQDAGTEDDKQLNDASLEAHARAVPDTSEWYPFKRKEVYDCYLSSI